MNSVGAISIKKQNNTNKIKVFKSHLINQQATGPLVLLINMHHSNTYSIL